LPGLGHPRHDEGKGEVARDTGREQVGAVEGLGQLRLARVLGVGEQADEHEKGREHGVHQAEHDHVHALPLDAVDELEVGAQAELLAKAVVDRRRVERFLNEAREEVVLGSGHVGLLEFERLLGGLAWRGLEGVGEALRAPGDVQVADGGGQGAWADEQSEELVHC